MYFDNKGKLLAQENYRNDQLDGIQITVHGTGKTDTKSSYSNGILNGTYENTIKQGN